MKAKIKGTIAADTEFLLSPLKSAESCRVNTIVQASDDAPACTIGDVVAALKAHKVKAHHDGQDWGDWIVISGSDTVISIESMRELTTTATIEHAGGEAKALSGRILAAFHQLGWVGVGEDGPYPLK